MQNPCRAVCLAKSLDYLHRRSWRDGTEVFPSGITLGSAGAARAKALDYIDVPDVVEGFSVSGSDAGGFQRSQHPLGPERHTAETDPGRVENRIGDGGNHWLVRRFPCAIHRQIGPVRIRITVDDNDVDLLRRIQMRQRWMRQPIDARDLFRIELHFFVQTTAHPVQHAALNAVPQRFWIDDQTAIVSTGDPLHPDPAGLSIHFNLGDDGDDGLTAKRVRHTAACQDVTLAECFR